MRLPAWPEVQQEMLDAEDSELEEMEDSDEDLMGVAGAAEPCIR